LLAAGASPDAYGVDYRRTALIAAASKGHREIVLLLLQKGATLDLTDDEGNTALDRAKELHQAQIVSLLEKWHNDRK